MIYFLLISRMISKMIGISAAQGIAVAVTSGAVELNLKEPKTYVELLKVLVKTL